MINYVALAAAVAISLVSAYFSIVGLVAIFPASFWPIVIMGSVLEVGKIVTASWLYRSWDSTPALLRYPLTAAVVALMLVTSMGTFGLLSKAHIDQQVTIASSVGNELQSLDTKIAYQKTTIVDLDKQVAQIDDSIRSLISRNQALTSFKAQQQQRATRQSLVAARDKASRELSDLQLERGRKGAAQQKIEADVGPLKYIAELVFTNPDAGQLERAVRWVIILLVFVFDPLAILLLIAANHGFVRSQGLTISRSSDMIAIHKDSIARIE